MMNTKKLTRLSFILLLIIILDYISRIFPFFRIPNGGTLSFVPTMFMVAALVANPIEGFIFGVVASVFTFFIGSQWFVNLPQYLFDYPIAIGGAIFLGSVAYKLWTKWGWPEHLKMFLLALKVTGFQFISYTIAFFFYLQESGIKGIGSGFFQNLLLIAKYNLIYMGPIMIGNSILAVLILPRIIKKIKS